MAELRSRVAVEDYVKVIFNLGEWETGSRTNANIAARLRVSTSSVSEMVRKLVALGLVSHEPYGEIVLTPAGRRRAVEMVRRHRLVETYLVRQLGYSWDEVHDEAEVLEHAVSALMVERMDYVLGHPWRDPHGDPIPTPEGVIHQPECRPLALLPAGEGGFVARIGDEDAELLRWFTDRGIDLDAQITTLEQKPFGGPLAVAVTTEAGRAVIDLGMEAVNALWVAASKPSSVTMSESSCPYTDCRHQDQA